MVFNLVSPSGTTTFFRNVLGSGQSVLIQNDPSFAFVGQFIANYYNSLPGVTATQTTSSVDSLTGVNLFISILPQSTYSPAQFSAMNNFLSGSGTVFFIGESTGVPSGAIAAPIITAALGALGSNMTMSGNDASLFPVNAIVLANPLTAGVGTFQYGFSSFVSGGTPLLATNPGGSPFIEVQTVGGLSTVPEPVSAASILGGLAGVYLLALRRRSI